MVNECCQQNSKQSISYNHQYIQRFNFLFYCLRFVGTDYVWKIPSRLSCSIPSLLDKQYNTHLFFSKRNGTSCIRCTGKEYVMLVLRLYSAILIKDQVSYSSIPLIRQCRQTMADLSIILYSSAKEYRKDIKKKIVQLSFR